MTAMLNRRQVISWAGALASGLLLLALAALFIGTGLDNAHKLASVVGAFVGVAGLAGSLYGLVLTRRSLDSASRTAPADTDAPAFQPLPEAARLQAPSGLAALPRPASRVFVGREMELARLQRWSEHEAGLNVQVVCGLGGVGKSELALQFADRNRGRFSPIWWIDAATPETLPRDLDRRGGDPRQARDHLADLLPLLERAWGKDHPNETLVAKDLHADYTGRAGDPAAARQLLAELLPIRERVSGADHPLTRATRANLARWAEESP